jgi:UDP-3-O-[3-hydroxymyristoyl] glucosamine N-acyltransferase
MHPCGRQVSAGPDIAAGAHVAADARLAEGVVVAPGAVVYGGAVLGGGVHVGSGTVIHAGTQVGERCVIEEGAVLGKAPRLRARSSAAAGELAPAVLGPRVTVCCGAIVYAGAHIAQAAIIGDQAQVRERTAIGERSVVGRGSAVDFGATVGADVLIQSSVYVTGNSIVEDEVFLGPGVLTTNDHSMGRHPPGEPLRGPIFRRACRIGGGAVLVPGIEIGAEAFVGAGAVVTRDVAEREVVVGVPASALRQVPEEDLSENWR